MGFGSFVSSVIGDIGGVLGGEAPSVKTVDPFTAEQKAQRQALITQLQSGETPFGETQLDRQAFDTGFQETDAIGFSAPTQLTQGVDAGTATSFQPSVSRLTSGGGTATGFTAAQRDPSLVTGGISQTAEAVGTRDIGIGDVSQFAAQGIRDPSGVVAGTGQDVTAAQLRDPRQQFQTMSNLEEQLQVIQQQGTRSANEAQQNIRAGFGGSAFSSDARNIAQRTQAASIQNIGERQTEVMARAIEAANQRNFQGRENAFAQNLTAQQQAQQLQFQSREDVQNRQFQGAENAFTQNLAAIQQAQRLGAGSQQLRQQQQFAGAETTSQQQLQAGLAAQGITAASAEAQQERQFAGQEAAQAQNVQERLAAQQLGATSELSLQERELAAREAANQQNVQAALQAQGLTAESELALQQRGLTADQIAVQQEISQTQLNNQLLLGQQGLETERQIAQQQAQGVRTGQEAQFDVQQGAITSGESIAGLSSLTGLLNTPDLAAVAQGGTAGLAGPLIGAGGMLGAASIIAASDRKLKKDISHFDKGTLARLRKLDGAKWKWKDGEQEHQVAEDGRPSGGVIAQELQKALPELVHKGKELSFAKAQTPKEKSVLKVDYHGLTGALVTAVRELADKVDALEKS